MKKLFLIDGNSFCYRAFYAIKGLTTSKGQPSGAVYGFVAMLNKLLKEQNPDYIAVSFDLKGPTFRHKKFIGYKIHRKPMPDELISQMPVIKEVVSAYNIAIFQMSGFEADDILATIVKKCKAKDLDIYIATGDKDALQLVDPRTKVYSPYFKEDIIYDEAMVKERFGVEPKNMIELMSLMGDASDNIPGVPGIGPKTASALIAEFSTVNNLLSNIDSLKRESVKELIKKNIELVSLSRELAMLDDNVPIDVRLEDMKTRPLDKEKLYSLFKELEFKALLKEFAPQTEEQDDVKYELIESEEKFERLLSCLKAVCEFALDFETTNRDPMLAEPVGISFCWNIKEVY